MDGEPEGLLEEDDGALDDGGVRLGLATQQSEEREKGEEREVKPTKGTLFTFTSGEENRHRVAKVVDGVRVALTVFFTCDPDFYFDI